MSLVTWLLIFILADIVVDFLFIYFLRPDLLGRFKSFKREAGAYNPHEDELEEEV